MLKSGNKTGARFALPVLFLGATAIGFAPIFVRLSEVGPAATAFWRIALALPFLSAWMKIDESKYPYRKKPELKKDVPRLALAGFLFAGDLAVWHWSIHYTTVANATLLANLAPIFVTLGAGVIFRERVTVKFLAGMIIALSGAFILMGNSLKISARFLAGDALGVLTAVFYGSYILTVNRLRKNYSTPAIMTWGGVAFLIAIIPIVLISGEGMISPSVRGWMVLVGLALISQVCGQGFIAFSLAYLPAPFASVSLLVQPMMAAIFAWIILGEGVGGLQILGGIVIIAGIIMARRASFKERKKFHPTDDQ